MRVLQPKLFWALFAAYFLSQFIVRVIGFRSLEWDQSEQAFLTQWWAWGYGIQPPLFNWLQKLLVDVVTALGGRLLVALLLLKVILVAGTHAWVYALVRAVSGQHERAVIAVFAMFLFPQYFWESLRDLSHTVLATHLCIASLFFAVQVVQQKRLWSYIGLGVCVGLALMAKYNTVIYFAVMLITGLFVADVRRTLVHPRMLIAVGVALVVSAVHSVWLFPQLNTVVLQTADKVTGEGAVVWYAPAEAVVVGLLGFFTVTLLAGVPLLGRLWFKNKTVSNAAINPLYLWLWLQLPLMVALLLVIAYVTGMTEMKDRYLQTFFISVPALIALFIPASVVSNALTRLQRFVALVWVISLAGIITVVYFGDSVGENARFNLPYGRLAEYIVTHDGKPDVVFTQDFRVAGNLVSVMPETVVVTGSFHTFEPDYAVLTTANLVWQDQASVPDSLLLWAMRVGYSGCDDVHRFQAYYYHSKTAKAEWFYCTMAR